MTDRAFHDAIETEVAVIGAGGAGLAAAIEARRAGAEVIILSRTGKMANNTAIAGGVFPLIGTPLQMDRGIQDSAELFAEDLLKANSRSVDETLVRTAVAQATTLYEWLIEYGVRFKDLVKFPGHSVARCHVEASWKGANVLAALLTAAEKMGVELRHGFPATGLMLGESRAVAGVNCRTKEGNAIQVRATRGVVLAAGGFGRNQAMMRQYAPEFAGAPVLSAAGSTGEGIRMAFEAGASLENMDSMIVHAASEMKKRRTVFWGFILEGAIMVNKEGERFVDESIGYAKTAAPVARQTGGMAFIVFDEGVRTRVEKLDSRRSVGSMEEGSVMEDPTAVGLAAKMGVPPRALERSLSKLSFQQRLYAVPVRPCVGQTHGGVKINERAQVIGKGGLPIPRLYAAGDVAAGLAGSRNAETGCTGYLTGTGYLDAFGFGRIAGRNVAARRVL